MGVADATTTNGPSKSSSVLSTLSITPALPPVLTPSFSLLALPRPTPAILHSDIASGNVVGAIAATATAAASAALAAARSETRAKALRKVRAGASGTYIGEILAERDSSIARWATRRRVPLTVWIQPKSNVADFAPAYVDQVRQAFEAWDALDLPVRFTFVRDSTRAEVHVKWIDRFTAPISGRTRWSRDDDWVITDADITLAMHHNNGELLDESSMHAMALHEIGHLLGLDHTRDTMSVMAPKVRVRELSAADRATVRLIYALPAGPLR
ncbi:MAG TPA: matrixin family metalloprotease [Gemmatimonadaceae bacterium]